MQPSLNSEPESPRTRANRANALQSTGPRTDAGKLRASGNALKHGLTSRVPVLRCEDREAYQLHCEQFRDEHQPQTPTETQLVQELADTAWRLNRVPQLEAELLGSYPDILDSHRALATLSQHGQRLSRQFQKTLDHLRAIQAERRERATREPKRAPTTPSRSSVADTPCENDFVFSTAEVEALRQPHLFSSPAEHQLFPREQHPSAEAGWSK